MLEFYHISRDCSAETIVNFAENGIQPASGRGYGGQSGGFYCWTSNENAERYYRSLLAEDDAKWAMDTFGTDIRLKDGKALKLKISINEENLKNPNWQLDNEQHAFQKAGRDRSIFLDFWEANKDCFTNSSVDFDMVKENGERQKVCALSWNEEKHCPTLTTKTADGNLVTENVFSTKAEDSYRTQAINDYLCQTNKSFDDNYNKLLLAAAQNKHSLNINGKELFTERLAIKYCGQEPIKNIELSFLQGEITVAPDRGINKPRLGDVAHGSSPYRLYYEEKKVNVEMYQKLKNLKDRVHAPSAQKTFNPINNILLQKKQQHSFGK